MVENEDDEKIEFTSAGGSLGHISLSEARVMALRTARASPARRHWILRRNMVFDVFNDYEDEDTYTIVLSFRPEGDFAGTPGQERFKFSKIGRFEAREVLSPPKSSMRFVIKSFAPVVGVIAVLGLIAVAVFVLVWSQIFTRYRGVPQVDPRIANLAQETPTTIRAEITNVSRFATGYTLNLKVETFSLPETNIEVRTTTSSGLTTEATTQFIRQPGRGTGIYFGTVIVGTEYIEDSSLDWVRNNITVEILLHR